MSKWKTIADIRREYGQLSLEEVNLPASPFDQFEKWFEEVVKTERSDPTAMVLATIDEQGRPDSRVVLLKGMKADALIFFTNYDSAKGQQIKANPYVSLNFYWADMARQVRIRGKATLISEQDSINYFSSRPILSQYGAAVSQQSSVIKSRHDIESKLNQFIDKYQNQPIEKPKNWGGYAVLPYEFEFWQGRDNRLHDRIRYFLENDHWSFQRLAP